MVFTVRFMFCFVYVEKVKIMRRQVIDWGKYLQKIKDLKKKKDRGLLSKTDKGL